MAPGMGPNTCSMGTPTNSTCATGGSPHYRGAHYGHTMHPPVLAAITGRHPAGPVMVQYRGQYGVLPGVDMGWIPGVAHKSNPGSMEHPQRRGGQTLDTSSPAATSITSYPPSPPRAEWWIRSILRRGLGAYGGYMGPPPIHAIPAYTAYG